MPLHLDSGDPDAKRALTLLDEMLRRGGVALKVTVGSVTLEGQFLPKEPKPQLTPADVERIAADPRAAKEEAERAQREELEADLYGAV